MARCHPDFNALKTGYIIHRVAESEMGEKTQFTFEIASAEPSVAEGEPVIQTLHQFFKLAERVVSALEALL